MVRQLCEIYVDAKDKMEKHIKLLFELKELPETFMGLQMETAIVNNGTRYYVMAVTPTRLYSFTGIGSLESVFASYVDRTVHFMELPGDIPNRISKQIVEELVFDQTPDAVLRGISGLCSDASAGLFYAYDQNSIFQAVKYTT
ncbi:PREDICTED: uncharacterized protein LOC109161986 isoform X2 [Ipomoea nil]|uniref:uncharacterized protein LOC109161986 isoform X2 n=1 Tax=Ipomoea nil TaxID=35883 RepID=UPI0009015321|nr:PREDICTED: uncharacterized protein LOC109161986 isoform X2 [Ipomoea nil]